MLEEALLGSTSFGGRAEGSLKPHQTKPQSCCGSQLFTVVGKAEEKLPEVESRCGTHHQVP